MKTDRSRRSRTRARRSSAPAARRSPRGSHGSGFAADLRRGWQSALATLDRGQRELQRQLTTLKNGRLGGVQLADGMQAVRHRLDRQRRKAGRDLERTLSGLQTRFKEQRDILAHSMEKSLRRTLAAFDVPSRHEVTTLTRRVEQLSRKIDDLPAGRRPARRRATA